MGLIDTDKFSRLLRAKAVDTKSRRLLVSRIVGSEQEKDLTEPPNCGGLGRIRHFKRGGHDGWPENPLPIDPASQSLALKTSDTLRAQAFQNAVCNWRCWYCFVPLQLLKADPDSSEWVSPSELVDRYLEVPDRPAVVDLSGGQPDLVPEWVPWTMEDLARRSLSDSTYLWSDDNLSNDYFWTELDKDQIRLIEKYPNYGRVCCFKGFDAESFTFNTTTSQSLFLRQFELFKRFLALEIDLYAYVTFTTPTLKDVEAQLPAFVDRLQELHPNLPLRTVPLKIQMFTPLEAEGRLNADHRQALKNQWVVAGLWEAELTKRFGPELRQLRIHEVPLAGSTP